MMATIAGTGSPAAINTTEPIPKIFIFLYLLRPKIFLHVPAHAACSNTPAVAVNSNSPAQHNTDVFLSWARILYHDPGEKANGKWKGAKGCEPSGT